MIADPAHWWDISRHQMVRDLPEAERRGSVEDHPVVRLEGRPWSEIPGSIQEVLKAAYDCASHDPDEQKNVSLQINEWFIQLELTSPSIQPGLFSKDVYGENEITHLRLQLVDDNHPAFQGFSGPHRILSGFWHFEKWPINQDKREQEMRRRREEEDIEPTIQERLMLTAPKTKLARASIVELEDLAEYLEGATPHATVWYVDHRFVPQIATPPWTGEATHQLTVGENEDLRISKIGEDEGMVVFEEREETLEAKQQFKQRILQTLQQLIADETMRPLWERFRFTYEERRQYPWLDEFGHDGRKKPARGKQPRLVSNPQKGLAKALESIFYNYDHDVPEWIVEKQDEAGMVKEVDDEFMQQVSDAVTMLEQESVEEMGATGEFILEFGFRNITFESITDDEIRQGLTKGMMEYWAQTYAHGYSGDPW